VFREVFGLSALAMLGLLLPILLFDLTLLVDLLANRGLPASHVLALVGLRVLPALGVAIAPAVLLAVIATLARMRAHNELTALESSGVALFRLSWPVLRAALLWGAVAAAITLELAPATHRRANAWLAAVALANPTALLQSGQAKTFANLRVHAREVSPDGRSLAGVTLWLPSIETTVFARRASVAHSSGAGAVVTLEQGRVLVPSASGVTRIDFEEFDQELVPVPTDPVEDPLTATSALDLWQHFLPPASLGSTGSSGSAGAGEAGDRASRLELHRRLGAAASTLSLAALGIALGMGALGRSRTGALLAGAALLPCHYALIQLGEGLARHPSAPPFVVWLPHVLVLLIAGVLVRAGPLQGGKSGGAVRRARRPALKPKRFALDRDWMRRFIEFAALCTIAGVVVSALIDVLDNLKWFTQYRAEIREISHFYGARIPILFSRVLPLALTIAAGLAMGNSAAAGELTAARACGIGPLRTIAPIVFACLFAAAFQNVLANEWVPRFSALASEIKQLEIKNRSRVQYGMWRHRGDSLFEIGILDPIRGVATDVVAFELDRAGIPQSLTLASSARHLGDGVWLLEEARRFDAEGQGLFSPSAPRYATWGQDLVTAIDTADLTLEDLQREITRALRDGYDPRRFRVDLHARFAAPLTCVVLPFLVLVFATTGPPFPKTSRIALVGLGLALVHGVGAGMASALGYSGVLSPPVAGWLPLSLLSGGAALWSLLRR
jgi:lipopolysaccharide export system permease protein